MADVKVRSYLEYGDKKSEVSALAAKARKDAEKKAGGNLKDIKVYIKPEDGKVYYAADQGKIKGDVNV
ncbi:MAG: DUF6465 family protein [Lachnospiraceae bacterium]|nr:DUF6465 family protein [Lachnospiraceae bacterium]